MLAGETTTGGSAPAAAGPVKGGAARDVLRAAAVASGLYFALQLIWLVHPVGADGLHRPAVRPGMRKGPGMGLFSGKKGMILGVANDFSIAWAIVQKLLAEGAELGFTHLPGDKMERRVRKLAHPIGAKLITSCDVQKDADVACVFDEAKATYGTIDFVLHSIPFPPIDDLKCPFVDASREGFKTAMDISVYSLAIVARHAACAMPDGGSIAAMTYFGGERVVPGYNMMGVCKAVARCRGQIPGIRPGAKEHPGQRSVGRARSRHWPPRRWETPTNSPASTNSLRRLSETLPARKLAPRECSCSPSCTGHYRRSLRMSTAATT